MVHIRLKTADGLPLSNKQTTAAAPPKVKIIIDSGAYSAWKLNKSIDLESYCNYVEANLDWIHSYVALDVINPDDTNAAASASFANLKRMRKRGLNPMAVYHAGEDISWLHRMLDLGCDYIGIAASSLTSRTAIDDWYSFVFSHLVNKSGLPIVKTHALGEGRVDSLRRFPWYSADSTSWIYSAQRGGIATMPNGQRIGMRHDGNSPNSAPDLDNLDSADRAVFDRILREHGISKKVFELRDNPAMVLRSYLTAVFYQRCQDDIRSLHPIKFHPHGFLHRGYSDAEPIEFEQFDLYLVCGTNNTTFPILAKLGHQAILASYFYIDTNDNVTEKSSGFKFKRLREFVNDPVGTVQSVETWLKYLNVLENNIHA